MGETDLEHQSKRRAYWRERAEKAEAENKRLWEALGFLFALPLHAVPRAERARLALADEEPEE